MRSEKPGADRAASDPPGGTDVGSALRTPHSALRAPLVVVSGPSGVGKTTVVEQLLKESNLPLRRAITATTRSAREGEQDGRDYHFWGEGEFRTALDEGRMLEWARVFDRDFYGTPKREVDPHRAEGKGVILVIDVQGAERIRELGLEHLSVFIQPPDLRELEARLRGRGDMSEDRIQRRLAEAEKEMAQAGKFQHQIVNRDLSEAVRELERLIRARFNQHYTGGEACSTS